LHFFEPKPQFSAGEVECTRGEFEINLELERKQFELDLKKEADLKDTAAQREGNLKYYYSSTTPNIARPIFLKNATFKGFLQYFSID